MGSTSRAVPSGSTSQGRRSRSQSRSRSRAGSEVDPTESNGYYGGSNGVNNNASGDPTMDFCNNFWTHGTPDDGSSGQEGAYDALMSRMKSSGKMMDEFRSFFKERAAIEEDYARRLAKLARQPLGREETGEFAGVLKRLQYELDQTGRCHNELASVIRTTLEARIKEFETGRESRRKNMQYLVEKSWKHKQGQEMLVQKALEKYKSDCILINSFSARLSLTQGKDMDKVTAKLDKVQQTVQVNEIEYKNYLKALKDTNTKWVSDWKAWCDLCQDLEEERIDFTRNALWSFVNSLSLLCVKDDESCENVRQTIEACDVGREIQTYVQRDGGAHLIPESPYFVDFSDGDKGTTAPPSHPAHFVRSSAKMDIPAFDGLEKLQALIYPQQGQQRRSVAGTPAPSSVQPSPGPLTPAHSGAPHPQSHTPQRHQMAQAQDITPQQPAHQAVAPAVASPTKREPEPQIPAKPDFQPPVPPAAFSASMPARSRPSSRAGQTDAQVQDMTTAEKLQYQASQKRTSAGAFKVNNDKPMPSLHYPYASASPRAAKPYEPPPPGSEAEQALKQSTSGVLPPPSTMSPPGPVAPSAVPAKDKKVEDPLLAALAKLRNPSSAVDVLPPTSPGVPGGIPPGAIGLPGMAARSSSQQQAQRSRSPYTQPANGGQAPPRSHSPYATGANARSNPNMASYSRPVSMTQSQSQSGPMFGQDARSRPTSPQLPMQPPHQQPQIARAPSPAAAMMRPPSQPHGGGPDAAAAVTSYAQSFPGERRQSMSVPQGSVSRPASPGGLMSPGSAAGGYAGVGSQTGRVSPAPGYAGQPHQQYQQGMRSPSPAPQPGYGHQPGYQAPPPPAQAGYGQPQQRPGSAYNPQQPMHPHAGAAGSQQPQQQHGRPTTPLGISLDATGSVTRDQMAERYQQQRQQTISPQPHVQAGIAPPASPYGGSAPHTQSNPPPGQQSAGYRHGASIYRQAQNRQSMGASPSQPGMSPAQPMSPPYGYPQGGPPAQQGPPPPQQGYGSYQQQPQQRTPHSSYGPAAGAALQQQAQQRPPSVGYTPVQQQIPPQPQQMAASQSYRGTPSQYNQQQPQHHQQQLQQSYSQPLSQQQPAYGYSQQPPASAQPYQQPQQQQQPTPAPVQQAANPSQQPLQAPPSHHIPPTGQYTEAGQPILFYVKAIYKYDATSAEEFSFQKDDVIGVYETDDDGWWKGELLDPDRARRSGGNLFPSNFTAFLD